MTLQSAPNPVDENPMSDSEEPQPSKARIACGGFLMGVANLVPGVSGGTMILAIGLYDRFIDAIAKVTTLRWSVATLTFMAVLIGGAAVAILALSGPAVWLVVEHRWIAYSLFIGMTLGGAPLLWKTVKPIGTSEVIAFVLALAGMIWVARGLSDSPIPQNVLTFTLIGALAASSMILPGISGSYILLIFGMYDVVVGSLRPRDLLDDPTAALGILIPVGIGVAIGIGLLSNVLKLVLARYERPSHAALLGLLLGSVAGLWPFQESVHPALSDKPHLEAVLLALEDTPSSEIESTTGVRISAPELATLETTYAGKSKGDLKLLALQLEPYPPSPSRAAISLALLATGIALTRSLGKR